MKSLLRDSASTRLGRGAAVCTSCCRRASTRRRSERPAINDTARCGVSPGAMSGRLKRAHAGCLRQEPLPTAGTWRTQTLARLAAQPNATWLRVSAASKDTALASLSTEETTTAFVLLDQAGTSLHPKHLVKKERQHDDTRMPVGGTRA